MQTFNGTVLVTRGRTNDPVVQQWATVIRETMTETVFAMIETGLALAQAKVEVGHGNWLDLLELVEVTPDTAERFMRIAANPALAVEPDSATLRYLPANYTTLSELARLEPEQITCSLGSTITPSMTYKAAVALVRRNTKSDPEPPRSVEDEVQAIVDAASDQRVGDQAVDMDRDPIHKGQRHVRPNKVAAGTAEQFIAIIPLNESQEFEWIGGANRNHRDEVDAAAGALISYLTRLRRHLAANGNEAPKGLATDVLNTDVLSHPHSSGRSDGT